MVQVTSLLLVFSTVLNCLVTDDSSAQTSPATPDKLADHENRSDEKIIETARHLRVGSSEKPVSYRVKGRLIWRTKRGSFRLQFGKGRKGFQLQGNVSELMKCQLGDMVEVAGRDIPAPTMKATEVRKIASWNGAPLNCEPAFQNNAKVLWRYVEHTAVIREILETDGYCRLFMGNKIVVVIAGKIPQQELALLLGTKVKVCGTSFQHDGPNNRHSANLLYIGVLDPSTQIQITKQQPRTLPKPETWLAFEDATVDYVASGYIALEGYGLMTAMSQHLQRGDCLDVKALPLKVQQKAARSIWLTKKSQRRLPLPELISAGEADFQKHLHRPVQVTATVEHCYATERGPELLLTDDQRTYVVNLLFPDELHEIDQYPRGAVVNLTGVVRSISQGSDSQGSNETIKLDVANSNDLVIAETPLMFRTWLVKVTAAGIVALGLLLGTWYWFLKRQVQRKTAELSTSTNRMVAAASAMRDGLLIFDAKSRVRFVNDNVHSTLGVLIPTGDTETQTKRRLKNLVREEDSFIASWNSVFQHPLNRFEGEFSLRESDRRVLAFSAPVSDVAGKPDGRIWTFEDVTQRRKLEDENLQTRKLGAIGRLAGGVAHDFNNLLQVIGSNLELMQHAQNQKGVVNQEGVEEEMSLEPALAAVRRGADLTRQLLTFARTSRVEISATDVNQLLDRTARMLDRTLGDHIRLSVSLTPNLPHAEIDSGQLEQVLINMCLNSSEAIGLNDGFIRISTKTTEHEQIGESILITVEDDGCGMSSEVLSHVFEPFFTTKDIDKGTGLGLSTAFGAIEQMRGRIECSSTVDEGTCFQIYLPASDHDACVPDVDLATKSEIAAPRKILLVDDDDRVLNSVRQLLNCLGHEVICAAGGAEAMEILQDEAVELVILDLSMPEMTGWQVLQKIREQHSGLKVVVCSGYSDDAAEMVASDVSPDAFLNKPFQLEQLSIVLDTVSK